MTDVLTTRDGLVGNSPRYSGYTSPTYKRFLQDDSGAAINLTGLSVSAFTLTLVNASNPTLIKAGSGTFTILNATTGEISYQYAQNDLNIAGNWFLFITCQLLGESTPRVFDPELLTISAFPDGAILSMTDINIVQVNGTALSGNNPVPTSGPVTIADGANVAQGATSDNSSASTTIGLLKAIKAYLGGTLTTTEANSSAIKSDLDAIAANTTKVGTALTPYGSNPAQTAAAGADTQYKFGVSGTTAFTHTQGQNNTTQNVYMAFDQSTTGTGNKVYAIAPGQFFSFDRSGTVLHFSSPNQQSFGGIAGITVEAFA